MWVSTHHLWCTAQSVSCGPCGGPGTGCSVLSLAVERCPQTAGTCMRLKRWCGSLLVPAKGSGLCGLSEAKLMINRKKGDTGGGGCEVKEVSVVSVPSLPAGHPVLLGGRGASWRRVALLLPDPHRMVLGHDAVVAGPLEEVTREGRGRGPPPQ